MSSSSKQPTTVRIPDIFVVISVFVTFVMLGVYIVQKDHYVLSFMDSQDISSISECSNPSKYGIQSTVDNVSLATAYGTLLSDHDSFAMQWTPPPSSSVPSEDDPAGSDGKEELGTAVYYSIVTGSAPSIQTNNSCATKLSKQKEPADGGRVVSVRIGLRKFVNLYAMFFCIIMTIIFIAVAVKLHQTK